MEAKKISFGFSKVNKKPTIVVSTKIGQKMEANKVELIKCLEGQEIKLVEEKSEEAPLVIPLKENQKTSAALSSLMKRRAVLLGEDEPMEFSTPTLNGETAFKTINGTDDIEKRAAKELLAELNTNSAEKFTSELVLPVVHPDDLPLEGAKESSLDDYDDIPVEQFGKAMLRGMGWVEPPKPPKGDPPLDDSPMVRPKGMGLGADKALKTKPLLVAPECNEVLQVKRNAFVRILGGKHKDMYGQIEGFDDHAGRVIVKMAIGGFKEAFNEFLCQPVAKKEFAQYGKCINSTKYEEYKRKENEHGQIILKKEEIAEIDKRSVRYEQIKRKTQEISSDEDCKMVERKTLKTEASTGSREKSNYYNDHDIKNERNYKREYKREDGGERSTAGYKHEERSRRRENTKDYVGDSKRDDYTKVERMRSKYRADEDNRERNKIYQKDSSGQSQNKESERSSERSCDKYEWKYSNEDVERKRDSNKDFARDQRQQYRGNYYDERKSRETKAINYDYSDNDDGKKYKKYSKDKKTKKKSKKSKKNKSKYQESSDSESSSSTSSNTSASEKRKKYKKKTKKSKIERERSRSRVRS